MHLLKSPVTIRWCYNQHLDCGFTKLIILLSIYRKIVRNLARWPLQGCISYIFKCTEWIQLWMRYGVPSCHLIFPRLLTLVDVICFFPRVAVVIFFYTMVVQLAIAKDPDAAFFKRLEGLQPCEVSELKAGTHIFAVYGSNYFLCLRAWFSCLTEFLSVWRLLNSFRR